MRVFITGASGHVGSALVPELRAHGHTVAGLARSDASADRLAGWGVEVVRGDLDDHDALAAAARAADGVVHLAFRHDAMEAGDFATAGDTDLAALRTIADALAGTGKPLVGTSATGLLAMARPGQVGREHDALASGYRIDAENLVVGLAARDVRASVVRLPPSTHSALDTTGFVPSLIRFAREHGVAAYLGDGANRWPAVHTLDAARLYRLALDAAPAGSRLHAVADEGVPYRSIAEAIARGVGVPARPVDPDEAAGYVGHLARFIALDNPATADTTRELLDWKPAEPGLLDDLADGFYFAR